MDREIAGRILHVIKQGIHSFNEIQAKTGLSSPTVSKYLRELEREGLITVGINKYTRKPVYELNEARMDEINALINAYLEHVKETTINNLNLILKAIKLDEETKKKLEEAYEALKARKRD